MKTFLKLRSILADQQGATAVLVGLMLIVLVGFLALAIDGGYVWVAQNELQNAADAGALAGARWLINDDGTININANQIAYDAATSNDSTNIPVEVNWGGGNSGDVQRGHWSLATRTFTPNANTTQTDLWQGEAALDADLNYINAVRVVTRRQTQRVNLFIAGILGHDSMEVVTDAVAWLGPPGNVDRANFDMPIALCEVSLKDGCAVGRMINSGDNLETYQTGGWTNFIQPCSGGGTNAEEVSGLVNEGCNGEQLLGDVLRKDVSMDTQGGQIQSAFTKVYHCWKNATNREKPWGLTLPVLECNNHRNITTCEVYRGAVEVEVVWITGPGEDPEYLDAPVRMQGGTTTADWDSAVLGAGATGYDRWQSFVGHFGLQNAYDLPASYDKKTIYFVPSCTPGEAMGESGDGYYGKMAKYPKLVE